MQMMLCRETSLFARTLVSPPGLTGSSSAWDASGSPTNTVGHFEANTNKPAGINGTIS